MEKAIEAAVDRLVELKWITLDKKVQKEAIVIVIIDFIEKMPLIGFIRWIRGFY